jgi:hypothetical protein
MLTVDNQRDQISIYVIIFYLLCWPWRKDSSLVNLNVTQICHIHLLIQWLLVLVKRLEEWCLRFCSAVLAGFLILHSTEIGTVCQIDCLENLHWILIQEGSVFVNFAESLQQNSYSCCFQNLCAFYCVCVTVHNMFILAISSEVYIVWMLHWLVHVFLSYIGTFGDITWFELMAAWIKKPEVTVSTSSLTLKQQEVIFQL